MMNEFGMYPKFVHVLGTKCDFEDNYFKIIFDISIVFRSE